MAKKSSKTEFFFAFYPKNYSKRTRKTKYLIVFYRLFRLFDKTKSQKYFLIFLFAQFIDFWESNTIFVLNTSNLMHHTHRMDKLDKAAAKEFVKLACYRALKKAQKASESAELSENAVAQKPEDCEKVDREAYTNLFSIKAVDFMVGKKGLVPLFLTLGDINHDLYERRSRIKDEVCKKFGCHSSRILMYRLIYNDISGREIIKILG